MSSIWTIRRNTSEGKLAGVCAGVARHWNVDPVLVRVGCVLLALSGGIGLVLYVAGWLLIPDDGKEKPVIHDLLGEQATRLSREVWIAIVVLACIVSVIALGGISPFGFGPALILALIWYFGYYRSKVRRPAPPPGGPTPPAVPQPTEFYSHPGPPTAFTEAAAAWRERIVQVQRETAARQAPGPVSPPAPQPFSPQPSGTQPSGPQPFGTTVPPGGWPVEAAEDRSEPDGWARPPEADDQQAFLAHPDPVGLYAPEPVSTPVRVKAADLPSARRLRLVGLLLLGLTLTGLAIADSVGVAVPAVVYLAAALLVVGLVLVAATWFGRARGILPVGIVLAIATAVATAVPQVPTPDQWQPHHVSYSTVAELPAAGDTFDLGAADVDLSQLALRKDATYTASVDLGALTVTVPPDVNVALDYTVDAGSVTVFGVQKANGTELHAVLPADSSQTGRPTLTLKLSADVGQIEVKR
jgi:phage shock protein PspC (stress-responsive transcriptional regulator)